MRKKSVNWGWREERKLWWLFGEVPSINENRDAEISLRFLNDYLDDLSDLSENLHDLDYLDDLDELNDFDDLPISVRTHSQSSVIDSM